jgi:hypothetical protein
MTTTINDAARSERVMQPAVSDLSASSTAPLMRLGEGLGSIRTTPERREGQPGQQLGAGLVSPFLPRRTTMRKIVLAGLAVTALAAPASAVAVDQLGSDVASPRATETPRTAASRYSPSGTTNCESVDSERTTSAATTSNIQRVATLDWFSTRRSRSGVR